uniref:Complement factor D n=1 Tax=Felis catus TaxID=9685 RepID=A0ABI8A739_FELCA
MTACLVHLVTLVLLGAAACAAQPRGRILGGREAESHARPYMASVQVNGKHVCGGFLVSERWVLSAAHCVEDLADGKLQVLLGAHSLSQPEPSKRLYDVLRAVPHPDSRPDTIDHDLLLLQLSEKAELGPAVQPLAWQRLDRDVAAGTLCDVAGWGVVTHTGRRPDRLQQLQLRVLDRATCNHRTYHDGTITQSMMCGESNRRDTCKVGGGRGGGGGGSNRWDTCKVGGRAGGGGGSNRWDTCKVGGAGGATAGTPARWGGRAGGAGGATAGTPARGGVRGLGCGEINRWDTCKVRGRGSLQARLQRSRPGPARRPVPAGRLRGPAGVRGRGRGRGHVGLARVRQPQEARHLHAPGELRGLDRRRDGRGRGRLTRPRGAADRGRAIKHPLLHASCPS